MNKRFIYLVLCILTILYIAIPIKASEPFIDNTGGTTTEVGGNDFLTVPQSDMYDFMKGNVNTTPTGTVEHSMEGDKYVAVYDTEIPTVTDENGNEIEPKIEDFLFGEDALKDHSDSKNYAGEAFTKANADKGVMNPVDVKIYKKDGKWRVKTRYEGDKSVFDANSLKANAAQKLQANLNKPGANKEQALAAAIKALGIKPENAKWYDKAVAELKELAKNPKALAEYIKKQQKYLKTTTPIKFKPKPLKVVNNPPAPGQGACEQWNAQGQPGSVTCDDGTHTGFRAPCTVSQVEEFMSSYTTTTPNNSDPWRRNEQPFCEDQRDGYLPFSEIMNPFGHRTWSKNDLVQNGLNQFLRKRNTNTFENNPWKSSWRGESRSWNPFSRNNRLSGIPYQIEWSPLLDSWTDQVHNINPMITKSIEERDKAEKRNLEFARKYGFNNPLKVYNEAPNPAMTVTALNLDTNTWDQADTTNIYCVGQYEMKIEPRYDIQKYDRYRLFDHHKTDSESYSYKCVKTSECKTWGTRCAEREPAEYDKNGKLVSRGRCIKRETYCKAYKTKGQKNDLGVVNTKYPKGMTTKGPTPAGSIPPVYKQRRKYQYRTGGMVEYHSITANIGNPRFRPVPNSYSDPTRIKAGYGFEYTSGMRVITDYDNDPRTYNVSPVIIRPNKAVPLNIRTNNYLRSIGRFDPNVRYDRENNAPSKSSSVDRNFIEEDLTGRMTRTTFDPSRISNVERGRTLNRPMDGNANAAISPSVRKTPINWNEMSTSFTMNSDPNKYYHAYWRTKGEPNLIPAYRPGPLHYIFLDYRSGTDYNVASVDLIKLNNNGFDASAFNSGSIRVIGNMWEDSFSRPDYKEAED